MTYEEFSRKLIESDSGERGDLLAENPRYADARLAESLQKICYEVWTSEPQKVSAIVETLRALEAASGDVLIAAYTDWTAAIENLVGGRLEDCLKRLDESEKKFLDAGKTHTAATTRISKLYALALLGRYDEAVECGLAAREVFLAHSDAYSAGKIEHNIGNLFWRRDLYREAEPFLASAHANFTKIGDQRQLAMVENCQAFVLALQNEFRAAEAVYEKALRRAVENNLTVTAAEIETGMSNLYLFQGRYDPALKYLERSRRKYELLGMPHQTANCELEIADIYTELNLLPEAIGFYENVEAKYAELGMQAELARSLLNHAKAVSRLGDPAAALEILERAERLFESEGNAVAVAAAGLSKAEIFFERGFLKEAERAALSVLKIFRDNGSRRFALFAEWLAFETRFRLEKDETRAQKNFLELLGKARADEIRPVEYRCLLSLGKLSGAEKYFLEAVALIENSRSALSAEEFRAAFFSDKLSPYNELVRLRLAENKIAEALAWHERARSRTLAETLDSASKRSKENPEYAARRRELNWFYNRINRRTATGLEARKTISELRKKASKLERELAEFERRLSVFEDYAGGAARHFAADALRALSDEAAIVEFAFLDDELKAFIVSKNDFEVYSYALDADELKRETESFLFQIKTGRFIEKLSPENRAAATARCLRRAQKIYDALLRPLEKFCGANRLVIIPSGFLHQLPFQALHDGGRFLIEKTEVSCAPSLRVLENCLKMKFKTPRKALLVGVSDANAPLIEAEIEMLGKIFEKRISLTNERATLENIENNLARADVLHLACHGRFRLDNPDFSALNLFEGNLTVRDARNLSLRNKLVVLSACETGLNKIVPGEELYGLTRGFLGGGAVSLIISLWTVADSSALELMRRFYEELLRGANPSKALRRAQLDQIEKNIHPYFWSPFATVGHW